LELRQAATLVRDAPLTPIPSEILDQFVRQGPLSAEELDAAVRRFKKALIERALGSELTHHLGYPPGGLKPEDTTNHRNGTSGKTVLTDDGPVAIEVPRDRAGTFAPRLIGKHERRFTGFDDQVLALYARGMTVREIQGFLADMYGVEVSPDLISTVTDGIVGEVMAWQTRPLEPMSPQLRIFRTCVSSAPTLRSTTLDGTPCPRRSDGSRGLKIARSRSTRSSPISRRLLPQVGPISLNGASTTPTTGRRVSTLRVTNSQHQATIGRTMMFLGLDPEEPRSGSTMRTVMVFPGKWAIPVLVVLCFVVVASAAAAQGESRVGTWELNLAKSSFSPGPAPRKQTLIFQAAGPQWMALVQGIDESGRPLNLDMNNLAINFDGRDHATATVNYDTTAWKVISVDKYEVIRKKAGKIVLTSTNVISKDGKTMTITTKGVNADGQSVYTVRIYDRQ